MARKQQSESQPTVARRGDLIKGYFQATSRRVAYVIPQDGNITDIRVPGNRQGLALHGDEVEVAIVRSTRREGENPTGEVVRVLRHANKRLIGQILIAGRRVTVMPKNPKIQRIVHIPARIDPNEVPDGAWVEVEIRRWTETPEEPLTGRLIDVLGVEGDRGLAVLLLIKQAGVPIEFPDEVNSEAEVAAAEPFSEAELNRRRDLRGERIMTIDPATAKDFDDAISLHGHGKWGWRVGVHIADVAHYVRPGTLLDDEAYERATSVYPVDRVIPMLPEALSNRACSLRPGEDKLTMSVFFTIDPKGQVHDVELAETIIHSVKRFAYEEVQGLFDEVDEDEGIEIAPRKQPLPRPIIPEAIYDDLMIIREAAQTLRQTRFKRGALDLDLPETKIHFGSEGEVVDLTFTEHYESHRLIEELMIAANEAVARTLESEEYPALYRVHEEPNPEKLVMIAPVLARLGIRLPGNITRQQLQQAIDKAHDHPAGQVVQRWVLRAMMRARYQPDNIGHYGLASDSYLHFTSPIRRYPDLIVHRAVKTLLGSGPGSADLGRMREKLPAWGRHTSLREERAQKIEWDAEETLALEYMQRYLGDVFEGFISGVSGMGFFVALRDYPVEGLVKIAQLDDDYYDLDDEMHIWRGRRSGRTFAMGDPVTVLIEKIDVYSKQMDLQMLRVKKGGGAAKKGRRKGGGTPRRRKFKRG